MADEWVGTENGLEPPKAPGVEGVEVFPTIGVADDGVVAAVGDDGFALSVADVGFAAVFAHLNDSPFVTVMVL